VSERDAAQQQIRPARRWIDVCTQLRHQSGPHLVFDERHLTTTAAIGITDDASLGIEFRLLHRIHRSTMRTFDPDGLEDGMAVRQA
jgi:hypothetical protein